MASRPFHTARPALDLPLVIAKRAAAACLLAFGGHISVAHAANSATCTDTFDATSPVRSSGFAQGLSNTRHAASSIDSTNVGQLALALSHNDASVKERRTAPLVTEQAIVFTSGRNLIAMNRLSGCTYWTYQVDKKSTFLIGNNAARSSSLAYVNEPGKTPLIAVGDFYGKVHTVDARTGQWVWSRFLGDDARLNTITGGLQAVEGKLIVPIATKEVFTVVLDLFNACCTSHGLLHTVDAYTGKTVWKYATTNGTTRYDYSTRSRGPSGMSIFGVPTVDLARRQVYIGTGQNLSLPSTANSDSIIALDLDSGQPKWLFQGTAGDAWNAACALPDGFNGKCPKKGVDTDFDFAAPPILTRTPSGRELLVAGQKSGVVYGLDPATGARLWTRKLGLGGALGGVHWGMATDGAKVYVAVTDLYVNKLSRINTDDLGMVGASTAATGSASGNSTSSLEHLVPGGTPGLYALDLETGQLVWERHITRTTVSGKTMPVIFSAALSVTNDVLLASGLDGIVRALGTTDGRDLWSYNTAVSFTDSNGHVGQGGTIDQVGAIVAGNDVLINSGYSIFGGANDFQAGPGSALFVLRLGARP